MSTALSDLLSAAEGMLPVPDVSWGGVTYTYDDTPGVWKSSLPDPGASSQASTTTTAPTNPSPGQLWFDGTDLMVRNSSNTDWSAATPPPAAPASSLQVGSVSSTTQINVSSGTGSNPRAAVTGSGGTANLYIEFPEIPGGLPASTPDAPAVGQPAAMYVVNQPATLTGGAVPASSYSTISSAVGTLPVSTLSNVSTSTPTNGQVMTYNTSNSEWEPTTPTAGTVTTINTDGDAITISGTTTQLPVVDGGSVNGTTLTLTRNGADDIEITGLPSGGGSTPAANIINVNGNAGITRLNFADGDATVTAASGVATVTIPGPGVHQGGTAVTADANILNFTGAGVTVTDAGNGQANINIAGGSGGTPSQTAVTNIEVQGNLASFGDSSNRSQFTLTGGRGGSKFKVLIKNTTSSVIQLKWLASNSHCRSLSLSGSHGWGVWEPGGTPQIRIAPESPVGSIDTWVHNANRNIASGEVMFFELDLVDAGTFQFVSTSSELRWYHAEVTQDTAAAEIEDVPSSAQPQPAPVPTDATGTPNEGYTGPFYIPFDDAYQEGSSIIPWNIQTNDNFNRQLEIALYATQMGGNGTDSPRSADGNEYWGTNDVRPRAGLWMESWGTTIAGGSNQPLNHGVSIVMPKTADTDPALQRLDQYATSAAAWHSHPAIYLRDDSFLQRSPNGAISGVQNWQVTAAADGHNTGTRVGFRSFSGPDNGPFSDQYTFSASSANYFGGYDFTRTGPSSGPIIHQYNRLAFNIPNDPDRQVLMIRRRGRPIETDPLLATGNTVTGYILAADTNPAFTTEVNNSSIIIPADRGEQRMRVRIHRDQFAGSNASERVASGNYWARAVVGTTPDYGTGTVNEGGLFRITSDQAGSDVNGLIEFDYILDGLDSSITGLTKQLTTPTGYPAATPGTNAWYGPITFRREEPMAVIGDSDSRDIDPATPNNASTGENIYRIGQARLWQIEYKLIT